MTFTQHINATVTTKALMIRELMSCGWNREQATKYVKSTCGLTGKTWDRVLRLASDAMVTPPPMPISGGSPAARPAPQGGAKRGPCGYPMNAKLGDSAQGGDGWDSVLAGHDDF